MWGVVVFVPLLFITALLYAGFSNVEKATAWKDRNICLLHLVGGVIMLGLGILLAFGIV